MEEHIIVNGEKKTVKNKSTYSYKNGNKKQNKASVEILKATIEKKKQCNAKALDVVMRLSDGVVTEKYFIENLNHVNQEYYQDIIEERAINKLCGYPLCNSHLNNVPAKKYHISTHHNKVFDITDRKNFCSNMCYKASTYLKDQIPTSPLWLREDEPSIIYKLICLNSKGGTVGEEVDLGFASIKTDEGGLVSPNNSDVNNLVLSNTIEELTDCKTLINNVTPSIRENESVVVIRNISCESEASNREEEHVLPHKTNFFESKNELNDLQSIPENGSVILSQKHCSIAEQGSDNAPNSYYPEEKLIKSHGCENTIKSRKAERKYDLSKEKSQSKIVNKRAISDKAIVNKIEQILREWLSVDSLCFILGEEKLKDLLLERDDRYKSLITNVNSKSAKSLVYDRYLEICKKLNLMELEDTKLDMAYRQDVKKPLPDYKSLKNEVEEMDLKVRMFYKGDTVVQFEEPPTSNNGREPVLPLVDLHAQKALRRRIVTDKFKRVLQDMQKSLNIKDINLTEKCKSLVSTFDLSAHNCTLRPGEWTLITICIIKLLSINDEALKEALNSNPTNKYLTLLLMSYSIDSGYLNRLLIWLTDIDFVLQKSS